jgi:hypothetical protein
MQGMNGQAGQRGCCVASTHHTREEAVSCISTLMWNWKRSSKYGLYGTTFWFVYMQPFLCVVWPGGHILGERRRNWGCPSSAGCVASQNALGNLNRHLRECRPTRERENADRTTVCLTPDRPGSTSQCRHSADKSPAVPAKGIVTARLMAFVVGITCGTGGEACAPPPGRAALATCWGRGSPL